MKKNRNVYLRVGLVLTCLMLLFALLGAFMALGSCGSTGGSDIQAQPTEEAAQTVAAENVPTEELGAFEVLPEEANAVFNRVINAAKSTYPKDSGMKRQYGYRGVEEVNGQRCYLFSVYDFDEDDICTKVGDFAGSVSGDMIFALNADKGVYEEIINEAAAQSWSAGRELKEVKSKLQNATRPAAESLRK